MKHTLRALALILALSPCIASAQQFPTVPDHSVIGRIGTGSGSGPSSAIPISLLLSSGIGPQPTGTVYAALPPGIGGVASPSFTALVDSLVSASAAIQSSKLSFLQSGTGATARTVQAKLQETLDAKDYGVLCDGLTNDTPALQTAINAADSLGGPTVILPAGTCNISGTVFLNKWAAPGILTVPGLKIRGQGKGVTTIDTRVANDYAISVNPAWKAAHQALFGITATSGGTGALATNTYYVQITVNAVKNGVGTEVNVTLPKSIAVTGPNGRISITLPPINAGYSYNLYCGTTSTPANYCFVSGGNASALGGNQTVFIDAIGTAQTVPTNNRAVWQNADISNLSITNSTGAANASGVLYFKAGYANLTNVYMQGLTGDGFDVPNYSGDIDGALNVRVANSKFDTISGWCVNAAGNVLENSFFTVEDRTIFNACGTLPTNLNTNVTISNISNSTTPVVTTSTAHNWLANDQIYISGVTGMTLAAGWYRVGTVLSSTTFNLKDLNGNLINTTSLGSYTASSGTGSLSWRPPTITSGSGALAWMGLIGTFRNIGFTQNNNVSMYFSEAGSSDNATLENIDFENTAGKGLYVGGLQGGTLTNSECLSTAGLGNTISCVQLGAGFANGTGVQNFKITNMKVRNNVTPANGFEQFGNPNLTPGAYADTVRVRNITWQTFDAAGQTRFNGFTFPQIVGQARLAVVGTNSIALVPVGYGASMPLKSAATGEWGNIQITTGVTQSIGPLSANTTYNFYLANSAAAAFPPVPILEASTTASTLDQGYNVKTGDPTRTFVGTITTDGSGNFQTTSAVASWYAPIFVQAGALTNHGIVLGQSPANPTATAAMTDGQILVGQTGSDPLPKTVSGDSGGVSAAGGLTVKSVSGTTTNDSAAAGKVGEYISSSIAIGSAVPLTTSTPANMTSVSLTAGDWDVECNAYFNIAGTTSITNLIASLNTTSATLDGTTMGAENLQRFAAYVPGGPMNVIVGRQRFSLSGTTTVFCVAQSAFTVSTNAAYGLLRARRVR